MTQWTDAGGFEPDALDLLTESQIVKHLKKAGFDTRMYHLRPTEAMRQQLREAVEQGKVVIP